LGVVFGGGPELAFFGFFAFSRFLAFLSLFGRRGTVLFLVIAFSRFHDCSSSLIGIRVAFMMIVIFLMTDRDSLDDDDRALRHDADDLSLTDDDSSRDR
jgi:hypothetical protein